MRGATTPPFFVWLAEAQRPTKQSEFEMVRELTATAEPDPTTAESLAATLDQHLNDASLTNEIMSSVDADTAKAYFTAGTPEQRSVRHGHFGELIASESKSYHDAFTVPFPKLRYAIGSGTLHGIDVLAVALEKDEIIELRYVESKFRAATDLQMAVEAHDQLKSDFKKPNEFPSIIPFTLKRLHETRSPLKDSFLRMLQNRANGQLKESYEISLCTDSTAWDERVLDRLVQSGTELLNPLSITIIRFPGSAKVIRAIFASVPNLHVTTEQD